MGLSIVMGDTPKWMVGLFHGKPDRSKWMITRGTPMTQETSLFQETSMCDFIGLVENIFTARSR